MTRLVISLLGSNQDRNRVIGGGNEAEHIAGLVAAVYQEACRHPSIVPRIITALPESMDSPPGSLSGLIGQQRAAADWIRRTRQPGDLTVSLNLHSDSGSERHCGFYYDSLSGPVSAWLGRAMADAVKRWFGGKVYSADYSGYYFATLLRDVACPVLMECGAHTIAADVAAVRDHTPEIAAALVEAMLRLFGIETDPPLNTGELRQYGAWSILRCDNGEDPRVRADFERHIAAIGADPSDLSRWGWPTC